MEKMYVIEVRKSAIRYSQTLHDPCSRTHTSKAPPRIEKTSVQHIKHAHTESEQKKWVFMIKKSIFLWNITSTTDVYFCI